MNIYLSVQHCAEKHYENSKKVSAAELHETNRFVSYFPVEERKKRKKKDK